MRAYRLLSVSILLLLTLALGLPAQARVSQPFCLLANQQCVSCGWGCEMLCTYYECDDGTTSVSCGACNCIWQCVVP